MYLCLKDVLPKQQLPDSFSCPVYRLSYVTGLAPGRMIPIRRFRQTAVALVSATKKKRLQNPHKREALRTPFCKNPASPFSVLAYKQPRWLHRDVLTDGATSWKLGTTFPVAGHIQSSIKF